jgi:hypothetical protein
MDLGQIVPHPTHPTLRVRGWNANPSMMFQYCAQDCSVKIYLFLAVAWVKERDPPQGN